MMNQYMGILTKTLLWIQHGLINYIENKWKYITDMSCLLSSGSYVLFIHKNGDLTNQIAM